MYRRPGRGKLLLLAFVILSILIITLSYQQDEDGPLGGVRDVAESIVSPIQRGVTVVVRPVRNFFSSLGDLGNLRDENAKLEAQVDEMETKVEQAEQLEGEVADLRESQDFAEPWYTMESINAEVIANTASNWKWAVTIDKGSEDGLRDNMAVIDTSTGSLVGKTIDVADHTATVLELIDPQSAAKAHVKSAGVNGLVRGNGFDEDLSLELIPPDTNIKVDDQVVTSAYNLGVFPPGIPIGDVSRIGDDQGGIELDIDVDPLTEFKDLQFLKVLLDTGPKVQAKGKDK
jgi:rod shape-determining protein MreC